MKTKLFYLFIAVFLFSFSGKTQTCPPSWPFAHCISLIGPGVSDWSTDVYLTSADGNVFTLGDVLIKETSPGSGIGGDIKFRRDGCWDSCPGNPAGYSSATGTGFPTGSGESVPFGPNIKPTPGVWNVTFTLSTKSWEFTPGNPVPTVKIFGAATTPATAPAGLPKVQTYVLPVASLIEVAEGSGLKWVNSDPEKIAQAQAAIAAEPKPVHVPRERPPAVVIEEGPLVLVETRKDLSNLNLPF